MKIDDFEQQLEAKRREWEANGSVMAVRVSYCCVLIGIVLASSYTVCFVLAMAYAIVRLWLALRIIEFNYRQGTSRCLGAFGFVSLTLACLAALFVDSKPLITAFAVVMLVEMINEYRNRMH